jgi:hypothetical protein
MSFVQLKLFVPARLHNSSLAGSGLRLVGVAHLQAVAIKNRI